MNSAAKFLYHRLIDRDSRWYPLLGIYYLSYRCSFRCPYCSNGFDQPYHQLPEAAASAHSTLQILARIRQHCEHLVITGGEPLEHPEAGQVLAGLAALKFKSVALNTNGDALPAFLPLIARHVDTLIVSLDTLDARKADAWFGKGPGTLQRILANLEAAASYPGRRYAITISTVATPNNIADLYEVYAYAKASGFVFAVCPELQGIRPPRKLRQSDEYRTLFDFLIAEKRQHQRIFGSRQYLEHMRDFRSFRCHPFALLVVSPQGKVFYPCLELGHEAGDLLAEPDLHTLRRRARQTFGPQPACADCCHSACALGLSLAIEHPLTEWANLPSRQD